MWLQDEEQKALRDLTRARQDMKHMQRQAKQRLLEFCCGIARHIAPRQLNASALPLARNDHGNDDFGIELIHMKQQRLQHTSH